MKGICHLCQNRQVKIIIELKNLLYLIGGLLAFFLVTLFASCEGYRCAEGIIYDSQTIEPIDSVFCKVITGDETQYSDSLGFYDLCNPFGGCVPDCPDIVVEFSKTGYTTKKVTNPGDIYLDK